MSDETVIAEKEIALPWDTDIVRVSFAAGSACIVVRSLSESCGYSNNDEETIEISWADVLAKAPKEALKQALAARGKSTDDLDDGYRMETLSAFMVVAKGANYVEMWEAGSCDEARGTSLETRQADRRANRFRLVGIYALKETGVLIGGAGATTDPARIPDEDLVAFFGTADLASLPSVPIELGGREVRIVHLAFDDRTHGAAAVTTEGAEIALSRKQAFAAWGGVRALKDGGP